MATIMRMHWRGVTAEQYEETCARLDWDELAARGAQLHVAGVDEDGLHVLDVWESPEHFQRFVEERLRPITEELGVGAEPPEVRLYPLQRAWAADVRLPVT